MLSPENDEGAGTGAADLAPRPLSLILKPPPPPGLSLPRSQPLRALHQALRVLSEPPEVRQRGLADPLGRRQSVGAVTAIPVCEVERAPERQRPGALAESSGSRRCP